MKRLISALFMIIVVSCIVFAGGKAETATTSTSIVNSGKNEVTVAVTQNLVSLDVGASPSGATLAVFDMVYDYLVDSDHNGNFAPQLATDWEVSSDGLSWTFHIREGVKFHNGEDLTADDVAFTFQRMLDNPTKFPLFATSWALLKSVEVIDDYTVRLNTKSPFGAMLTSLSGTAIIPADTVRELGDAFFTDGYCYGTGPWKYEKWIDGQYISFTKNDDYWAGQTSNVDRITMRFITESSSIVAGLVSGTIDATGRVPSDMLSQFTGHPEIELGKINTSQILFIGLQCGDYSVFHDENVRKAFSYAIDRQLLCDAIMGGGKASNSIMSEGTLGFDPSVKMPYDPQLAKEFLQKSNYKGEEIIIYTNTAIVQGEEILLAVCDMVNSVGFNCKIQMVEQAFINDVRKSGKYDAYVVTASFTGADPYAFLNQRILSDSHHHNYGNQELNDLISLSNQESDPVKRNDYLKAAAKLITEHCAPQIALFNYEYNTAIRRGVMGVEYSPEGLYYFDGIYLDR